MFLSEQLNEDVRAIIAEGKAGVFVDTNRAHRLYVRLCHIRKWDSPTATAVYWAWQPVLAEALKDDDIPF
jgi:hypothetical protein